jgi:carnitine 3-dehydrogenase
MNSIIAAQAGIPSDAARPKVAVLGAGTIGSGWAAFFALSGLEVRVADTSDQAQEQVLATLERARPVMRELGLLSPHPTVPHVTRDIAQAVAGAAHIQEALPENLDLKHRVYQAVEAAAGTDTIIASSSSGLQPSALQAGMRHPQRLVVAHPNNPPYLMPLVEIVGGSLTSERVLDETEAFYQALGKKTVRLRKEITGHLVNRLQAALWREAVHLVAEGYASVADVDRTITEGLGARWAICGPHEIFHLSGGNAGMAGFLERLGPAVESWWADLGNPVLDARTRQALIDGMAEAAQGRSYAEQAGARDRRVIPVLAASKAST